MVRQEFTLDGCRWHVRVFYEASREDAPELFAALKSIGCHGRDLLSARRALAKGEPNYGITYSNFAEGESVMIIGKTTSADEFQNSYDHEKGHLCKHIVQSLRVDPFGEEAEYIAGEIGQKTFPKAKRFLCEHCRRRTLLS